MIPRRAIGVCVLVPVLAAALAVAAAAYAAYGGEAAFTRQQAAARPARAVDLERVMLTTQEPYGEHTRTVIRADCRARGTGELQNPWRCGMRYASGRRAAFRVELRGDGSFRARHLGGSGSIVGCCVELAGRD